MNYPLHKKTGFGVVEVLVAVVIFSLVLVGLHSAAVHSLRLIQKSTERTQAIFLLNETIEVLLAARDSGWSTSIDTLSTGTDYFLSYSGGVWTITTTNIFIDNIFERTFTIEDVYRDANNDIAGAGVLDSGTKKIHAMVSWRSHTATTTQTISTYITDLFQN
jgi:Tfp pilus assembly protein PilV